MLANTRPRARPIAAHGRPMWWLRASTRHQLAAQHYQYAQLSIQLSLVSFSQFNTLSALPPPILHPSWISHRSTTPSPSSSSAPSQPVALRQRARVLHLVLAARVLVCLCLWPWSHVDGRDETGTLYHGCIDTTTIPICPLALPVASLRLSLVGYLGIAASLFFVYNKPAISLLVFNILLEGFSPPQRPYSNVRQPLSVHSITAHLACFLSRMEPLTHSSTPSPPSCPNPAIDRDSHPPRFCAAPPDLPSCPAPMDPRLVLVSCPSRARPRCNPPRRYWSDPVSPARCFASGQSWARHSSLGWLLYLPQHISTLSASRPALPSHPPSAYLGPRPP